MDDFTKQLVLKLLDNKSESNININNENSLLEIGKNYFIRTVTYHYVGKLKEVKDGFAILETSSWISDSGRLSDALQKGFEKNESSEIEPINGIIRINLGSVTDIIDYNHELPTSQK
jgi:hypothetical protein